MLWSILARLWRGWRGARLRSGARTVRARPRVARAVLRAIEPTGGTVTLYRDGEALDVSIRAQVLILLKELQERLDLTYLFIAHDLATVAYACDRVAVMYLGQLVEVAPTRKLFYTPLHPYTEALMSAIPAADPDWPTRRVQLQGEQPNPMDPPTGCRSRS